MLRAPGIKVNKYYVHTASNLHQYLKRVREMALNKFFYSAAYSQSLSLREDQTAIGTLGGRETGRWRNTGLHPFLRNQVSAYQKSFGIFLPHVCSHIPLTILFHILHGQNGRVNCQCLFKMSRLFCILIKAQHM